MKARDHYEHHLGNFYSWMVGDFNDIVREQQNLLKEWNIKPISNKIAFDLGCGNGLQCIPLAKTGFKVKAVDFNQQLLDELAIRSGDLNIEIVKDDILHFLMGTSHNAELITCMGDTLTHLESLKDVRALISNISTHLEVAGKAIFSFRDLTTELKDEQRFIPVRSDDSKILTCFLEYFSDHVIVHDILHENQDGKWIQRIGSYPKLRLAESAIVDLLQENKIEVKRSEIINRMIYLLGQRIA